MSDEAVPYEKEITALTALARRATGELEDPAKIFDTAVDYERKGKGIIRGFTLSRELTSPDLMKEVRSGDSRQKLFLLISALIDAHLDLYESATRKSAGANIVALADGIRLPALGVLQAGYMCLAQLRFSDPRGNMPELERLLRRGEASSANRDDYVRQAIDMLRIEIENRKQPASARPNRQADREGKRGKETVR